MSKPIGFSFIEILISLFFLSLMLLGIDAMQLIALQQSKATYFFSIANQQILNLVEKRLIFPEKNLNEAIEIWQQQTQHLLPQGQGEINLQASEAVITVFWGGYPSPCEHTHIGIQGCVQLKISSLEEV